MNHIKPYNIFESYNFESIEEVKSLFNLITEAQIIKIPYYKHTSRDDPEFYIYILYGNRVIKGKDDDKENPDLPSAGPRKDYKTLQEIYQNVDLLKNIYNLDIFHISLKENKISIIFKEHLRKLRNSWSETYLHDLNFYDLSVSGLGLEDLLFMYNIINGDNTKISSGIDYSDGSSGNLSLFDWQYS